MINKDILYIESHIESVNKRNNNVCGDYTIINRTHTSTDFVLCDGLGSGLKANIAAIACASRIIELVKQDIPLLRTAEKVVELMKRARKESIPYATFTIVRILPTGQFTIINYENPTPILINNGIVQPIQLRHFTIAEEIVSESNGILAPNDSLIMTSDGITQAGLGILPGVGWGNAGLEMYLRNRLSRYKSINEIAPKILNKTYRLSGDINADDATVAILTAREANIINIITGPPLYKERDVEFSLRFLESYGKKIICGSSTSDMVARVSGKTLRMVKISSSITQPPKYSMDGIDLVTEGAITLNQVYNILEENPSTFDKNSCVTDLAILLREADVVNIYLGQANNEGHSDITFKQLRVLPRRTIVPLLCDKLKTMGKLVKLEKQ